MGDGQGRWVVSLAAMLSAARRVRRWAARSAQGWDVQAGWSWERIMGGVEVQGTATSGGAKSSALPANVKSLVEAASCVAVELGG